MIQDSGNRREFPTGGVRDIQEGKGRCDLLPFSVLAPLLPEFAESIFYEIEKFCKTGSGYALWVALDTFIREVYGKDESNRANAILELAKHFEDGAVKYGENNWQKGLPTHCYIDSAIRHLLKYIRGDNDERHDRAFIWNIVCCRWTCENKPELNEYGKEKTND